MKKKYIIPIIIIILFFAFPFPFLNGKKVHLSIDDFYTSFIDLKNEKYGSIYDQPTFHYLKSIHDVTNAKFTLYTFSKAEKWSISEIPTKYINELNQSNWIKIGYHSDHPQSKNDNSSNFQKGYLYFESNIPPSLIAKALRLHYFHSSLNDISFLKSKGIIKLFSADDNRISYSLPQSVNNSLLQKQAISYASMTFEKTDFRIEHHFFPLLKVWSHIQDDVIVIFTHEWALNFWNAAMLRIIVYYFAFYGCTFIME